METDKTSVAEEFAREKFGERVLGIEYHEEQNCVAFKVTDTSGQIRRDCHRIDTLTEEFYAWKAIRDQMD